MKITALVWILCLISLFGESINIAKWSSRDGANVEQKGELWKVDAPKRMGGISMEAEVPSERRCNYFCEVRGSGMIQLGISGSEGWAYSPKMQLSDEWKAITKSYICEGNRQTLAIYNISETPATFEVRNVIAQTEKALAFTHDDVPPVLCPAAEYPGKNCIISQLSTAYEGNASSGGKWYVLAELPVPLTDKPLYYYAHVLKNKPQPVSLYFLSNGQKVCKDVQYDATDVWSWVRFPAIKAALAYPNVSFSFSSKENLTLFVDKFAISTNSSMSAAELDAVPRMNDALLVGKGTPEIDGKLDDTAWNSSPVLAPFLLQKQNSFARQQTEARLCWDDSFFYVSFKCHEKSLEPRENKLHEFKHACRTPDNDAIYNDDAVEVLLWRPETPDVVYDICTNSDGTVSDSISKVNANDLWSSRDRNWSSGCRVRSFVHNLDDDGYWSIEIAIPLEKLGGKIASRNWKALVSRTEKAYSESSSFSYVPDGGVHFFKYLRTIELSDESAGCELLSMPNFVPGNNTLTASIKSKQPMTLEALIECKEKKQRFGKSFSVEELKHAELTFPLTVRDVFTFSWRLYSSGELKTYFSSPKYSMNIVTSILNAKVDKGTLLVNNEPIGKDVVLRQGHNTLRAKGADVNIQLTANEIIIPFPEGWKKTNGEYTLNLMSEMTTVWPNWNAAGGVTINRGGLQQLLFFPNGFKGFKLDDYTICLDLPVGMSLLGATGYYKYYPLELRNAGKVSYSGKEYTRYEVKITKTIEHKNLQSHELLAFILTLADDFVGDKAQIYYFARSVNSAILELPNRINVNIIPKASGTQWKILRSQMWTSWLTNADNVELAEKVGKYMKEAGVTEWGVKIGEKILPHVSLINFESWNFSCANYIKANPDAVGINKDGKPSPIFVCASDMALNPKFGEYCRNNIVQWHQRCNRPQNINLDYESSVYDGFTACYCNKCLNHFAEEAGIHDSLSYKTIKEKYEKEWTAFTNKRLAQIVKVIADAIHEKLPGVIFSLYSGYQSELTKSKYGIDWSLIDGIIDLAEMGYGRNEIDLAASYKALKNTPLLIGALVYPYRHTERSAPSFVSPAELMRRVCDSSAGYLIYNYPTLDGRTFLAIAQVSNATSKYEEFFAKGKKRPELLQSRNLRTEQYQILEDENGNLLFAIVNQTNARLQCSPQIAGFENFTCINAVSGKAVNDLSCFVEPDNFALFYLKKK